MLAKTTWKCWTLAKLSAILIVMLRPPDSDILGVMLGDRGSQAGTGWVMLAPKRLLKFF